MSNRPPQGLWITPPNLPHRGRGTAAPLFYGIAATGSYFRFNSLRDAPPEGEAFNLPLRGRGTAAAVEEGRYGRERCVFISRSRPERPSSVSLTRASTAFYGIAATGSYFRFNSLRDAPPGGEAFNLPLRGRGTADRRRCVAQRTEFSIAAGGSYTIISWKRGVMEESGAYLLAAPARSAPPQSGLRPASSPGGEAFSPTFSTGEGGPPP